MNELLGTVIEGLQYHIKEYNVTINVQPNLPHCMGDAILLSQVFTNLLDNAIKYRHPDRSLVIKITATVIDGMAEYNIADNGIGIEPEHLEKVFELFHQLGDTKDEDGQGVGLTIVRRILDRLNGNVKIDSTPNVGTTVHIRLPMT
jgi:signal transduction histidine kinase